MVVVDRCKCRRGEAANRAAVLRGEPPEKETGQNHPIPKPLAERGHPHRDLIQPVIEVLAKTALGHQAIEVLICCTNDPSVDLYRLSTTDPLDYLVLQET